MTGPDAQGGDGPRAAQHHQRDGESVILEDASGHDVITGKEHSSLHLDPWGYVWLRTQTPD